MCNQTEKCCCINLALGAQIISVISTLLSAFIAFFFSLTSFLPQLPAPRNWFYGAMGITAMVHCFSGCLLIFGVFKDKPRLIWPWLILSWVKSVVLMLLGVLGLSAMIYGGTFDPAGDANIVISTYIVYSLFLFYMASVVNCNRIQISREEPYQYTGRMMRPTTGWKYV